MLLLLVALLIGCGPSKTAPDTHRDTGGVSSPPAEGDPAPDFQATDHRGRTWSLSEHTGDQPVVLYFYPAAMTRGCTKQACSFRDQMSSLNNLDATVVGISGDEVRNLQLFRRKNNLHFTLLSDPDGSTARKFGVPVEKGGTIEREVDGKTYTLKRGATFERWTFIIDRHGNVVYRDTDVKPTKDSKNVISVLKQLES